MKYARIAAAAILSVPATVWPHAFDDRYDLPAPLAYFVAGAAAAVGLSFVVAAVFARRTPALTASQGSVISLGPLLPVLRAACRLIALVLFVLTVVAMRVEFGFAGCGRGGWLVAHDFSP